MTWTPTHTPSRAQRIVIKALFLAALTAALGPFIFDWVVPLLEAKSGDWLAHHFTIVCAGVGSLWAMDMARREPRHATRWDNIQGFRAYKRDVLGFAAVCVMAIIFTEEVGTTVLPATAALSETVTTYLALGVLMWVPFVYVHYDTVVSEDFVIVTSGIGLVMVVAESTIRTACVARDLPKEVLIMRMLCHAGFMVLSWVVASRFNAALREARKPQPPVAKNAQAQPGNATSSLDSTTPGSESANVSVAALPQGEFPLDEDWEQRFRRQNAARLAEAKNAGNSD